MNKKLIIINQLAPFILLLSLVAPHFSFAAPVVLFSDSFGSIDTTNVPEWNESGNGTVVTSGTSGEDMSRNDSPTPQFAKIDHNNGFICEEFTTTGYTSVHLHYYWNGDADAESSDHGLLEWKNGHGVSCTSNGDWTVLATSTLTSTTWSSEQDIALPAGDVFSLRFRNDANSTNEFFRVDDVSLVGNAVAANVPPTATGQSVTTDEDTAKAITLAGADSDGTVSSFALMSNPTHGALSGFSSSTGALTYTSFLNYNGADSFTFRVTDNSGATSTPATVNITVTPVNDPPFITAVTITPSSPTTNQTLTANVTAGDVDLDVPTFTYQWQKNGSDISGATASTLNLSVGGNGDKGDVISVAAVAHDAATTSVPFTSAGVTVQNTAPLAINQSLPAISANTSLPITLVGTDVDSDALTYAVGSGPLHGSLSDFNAATGAVIYTPSTDYSGADSFTFTANDGTATSVVGTVNVSVNPVNGAPVLTHIDNQTVDELSTLTFTAHASDAEEDPFHFSIIGAPDGASIDAATGVVTWTPTEAQGPGSYTFMVRVTQDNDESKYSEQNVTVQVNEVPNEASSPVAVDGTATTTAATPVVITLGNAGESLTYLMVGAPLQGTLSAVSGNHVTYTPDVGFGGYDSFTFRIFDSSQEGEGAYSNTATVKITVIDQPHESPVAGGHFGDQDVSFFAAGASGIYYTVDRSDPACGTGLFYSYPITIRSSNLFKVIACYDGGVNGNPVANSGVYTFEYDYLSGPSGLSGGGGGAVSGQGPGPSFGGGQVLGVSTTTEPEPQVLGIATTTPSQVPQCTIYLTNYLHPHRKNNAEDVKKLQQFLNNDLGSTLAVNGIYNAETTQAVEHFQLKYDSDILVPWVPFGLKSHVPTGFAYKLTIWKINTLADPACVALPQPQLP